MGALGVGKLDIQSADGHHVEPSGYVKQKKAGSAHIMTSPISAATSYQSSWQHITEICAPVGTLSTSCLVLRYATSGVPLSL